MKAIIPYFLLLLLPFSLAVPPGAPDVVDLGITWDRPQGDKPTMNRFSSKLTWDNLPNNSVWKDKLSEDERKLSRVAKEAYWQMMNMFFDDEKVHQLVGWKVRPSVMTALAVESDIFLSSSITGGNFVYHGRDRQNP